MTAPAGTSERIEVSRLIPAPAADIFAVVSDPRGQVAIDASGMLMSAGGARVGAVGDKFVVHMDREALGDFPMGRYEVTVIITKFSPDALLEWAISGRVQPPLGHLYGYVLTPTADGTEVTSYCDWSGLRPEWRERATFPIVPASTLKATLGILTRVVLAGGVPRAEAG